MIKLSKHFTLEEMTFSETGLRHGHANRPKGEELKSLQALCDNILEPLRAQLRQTKPDAVVVVNSGFRSQAVNELVGGAKHSAHVHGRAADIRVPGMTAIEVCRAIVAMRLPYDQVIHEFGSWCHVAIAAPGTLARRQELTIDKFGTRVGLLPIRRS